MPEDLEKRLIQCYIYEKHKIRKAAKLDSHFDTERLELMAAPHMKVLAATVKNWNFKPDLIMESLFAYARANRQPDGPQWTMIKSVKYLMKALSWYLDMPWELINEDRSLDRWYKNMDKDFAETAGTLIRDKVDIVMATSIPVEFRFVAAFISLQMDSAKEMAHEVLDRIEEDAKVGAWLEHRGFTYRQIAASFIPGRNRNHLLVRQE